MSYFVTAISTNSGKTLVSAILAEALQADYWKPIQSGLPRDTETVQSLISNPVTRFHKEQYFFKNPVSPHQAAALENIRITLSEIQLPTQNKIIVEGAGGILVPINESEFIVDIIQKLKLPVVLVSNFYLGSINHTLLTFQELIKREISIAGIVFNGNPNPYSEQIILHHTQLKVLLRIPTLSRITKQEVRIFADEFLKNHDSAHN
ncbi:MAG: dethiobiotin synthase [Cytophagales bacterium]|nr:dethiobiotin synthase [Cytophagales bacterium]MDW8384671.1 dethiobiotin synthase [Flammeovirgaceae bacterium]